MKVCDANSCGISSLKKYFTSKKSKYFFPTFGIFFDVLNKQRIEDHHVFQNKFSFVNKAAVKEVTTFSISRCHKKVANQEKHFQHDIP